MYKERAEKLQQAWEREERWKDIKRPYSAEDVIGLRGSLDIEHTLAKKGSEKLWNLINTENYVNTLGALTGNQAVQQVRAGLKEIGKKEQKNYNKRGKQKKDGRILKDLIVQKML